MRKNVPFHQLFKMKNFWAFVVFAIRIGIVSLLSIVLSLTLLHSLALALPLPLLLCGLSIKNKQIPKYATQNSIKILEAQAPTDLQGPPMHTHTHTHGHKLKHTHTHSQIHGYGICIEWEWESLCRIPTIECFQLYFQIFICLSEVNRCF